MSTLLFKSPADAGCLTVTSLTGPIKVFVTSDTPYAVNATVMREVSDSTYDYYSTLNSTNPSIVLDAEGEYCITVPDNCCDIQVYYEQILESTSDTRVSAFCSTTVTFPAQVYFTGYISGTPPELPEIYTSGITGENLTLINSDIRPHQHPRFDAAGAYNGYVYSISPNAAPSETMYLNRINSDTGSNEEIISYTAADIVNFAGDADQLAAKGGGVIGNILYVVVPSKFLSTIGRMIEINLDTHVATDIGQAPLTLGIGDDLMDVNAELHAFDDGAIKVWDFGTNTLGATVFSFPVVGDGWAGAAYWDDGYYYAVAYTGTIPNRTYTLVRTVDGTSHEEFALAGIEGNITLTDAALVPSYEDLVTAMATVTCEGVEMCCVNQAGEKIDCPAELDSLADVETCIAEKNSTTTVVSKDTCAQIPAQTGAEVTGNAAELSLISITDANASCVSEFTYGGTVYSVDPNVCVKEVGEVFDGDFSEFALAFRDAFYALTGVQMPSIVGVGESSEIIIDQPVYAGLSFSTAPETVPTGIASDGNFYYDVGGGDIIRVRDLDGVLTGAEYSVLAQTNFAQDIAVDDNFIWVASKSPDAIFQYNKSDGTYTGFTFAVTSPDGIAIDDEGFLWIINDAADTVSRFDPSTGIATGETFSLIAAGVTVDPSGIEWIDGFMWITDSSSDSVYQFDTSGNINAALTFSVASQDISPLGITYDGTHIVIVGNATDTAYKYAYNAETKYTLYVASEGDFDASLLTAMTMVNKDAGGAVVETKSDVVGVYQEYTYDTLTFDAIYQRVNQVICYSGCDETSRRLEALDGSTIDPSFVVIPCDSRYRDNSYMLLTDADSPYTVNGDEWHSVSLKAIGGDVNLTINGITQVLPSGETITFNTDSTMMNEITVDIPVGVKVMFVGLK